MLRHEALHPLQPHLLALGEGGDLLRGNRAERDKPHRRGIEVHADHSLRRQPADLGPDNGAGIAALHAEALVAQPAHQLDERLADADIVPPGFAGRAGKAEARQRRHHHVERVLRLAAMRHRIGQRPDHVEELDDGARPAVDQQQRGSVFLGRLHMDEVDVLAVDLGGELRQRVDLSLGLAPVEAAQQPVHGAADIGVGRAGGPAAIDFARHHGAGEAILEILQLGGGNVDLEGGDGGHFGYSVRG